MRNLLEFYKNLIREGYIEAINIKVFKLTHQPQPQEEDEELYIPVIEFVTGFTTCVEMDDFQDDAMDALDQLNYYNVDTFEFELFNNNDIHAPVLVVKVMIGVDE